MKWIFAEDFDGWIDEIGSDRQNLNLLISYKAIDDELHLIGVGGKSLWLFENEAKAYQAEQKITKILRGLK